MPPSSLLHRTRPSICGTKLLSTTVLSRPAPRFGRLGRYKDASHVRFPEGFKLAGIFTIVIADEKPGLDALIFHPHESVARLLYYPLRIGMIGARATKHLAIFQMDDDQCLKLQLL